MPLSCEDAYTPFWGSRGRRFMSGRPDAGQKADPKSGIGLLAYLGPRSSGRLRLGRFLT